MPGRLCERAGWGPTTCAGRLRLELRLFSLTRVLLSVLQRQLLVVRRLRRLVLLVLIKSMKTFSLVVMLVVIVLALGFGGVARTAVASTDTWEVDCQLTQAQLALGDEGAAALIYAWNPQWV